MIGLRRRTAPVDQAIDWLRREGRDGRLVHLQRLAASEARFAEPRSPLPDALRTALAAQGIRRLYAHQADAFDRAAAGEDLAVVTPTASGKSLCFALPLFARLLAEPGARALLVYPTNALVHDQERMLRAFAAALPDPPAIATLTGATPPDERRLLRAQPPRILLTNPEMLHLSLTGSHRAWARLHRGLRLLVLDEAHLYRGTFGTHMALTVRRLLRATALHGGRPQVIACTATVGNPGELVERLTGRACAVIEAGGAGRGARTFAVWAPRERGPGPEGEAVALFAALIKAGLGTILFTLTRRGAEAAAMRARELLGPALAAKVAPYRNGYTPEQRRSIEERLKRGELLGVVATNALEVGIDIGGLDAAVIAGFPGSRTSLWQQAGRAGRGMKGSLVVFVPYPRVVDGYYAAHPAELLAPRFEDAVVDLTNPRLLAAHLACAAAEAPLDTRGLTALGADAASALAAERAGALVRDGRCWLPARPDVHGAVSLRGGTRDGYEVRQQGRLVGTLDAAHLGREAHLGAVYLHEGARYRVAAVDRARHVVEVVQEAAAVSTRAVIETVVQVKQPAAGALAGAPVRLGSGALRVRQTTTAFQALSGDARRPGPSELLPDPPVYELETAGCWLVLAAGLGERLDGVQRGTFLAGLHGAEHLLPAAVSLRLLCDARDVQAAAVPLHAALGGPVLFLYDAVAGGAGIAERAAGRMDEVLRACLEIVRDCRCNTGCPRCVSSAGCWQPHGTLEKGSARLLLEELLRHLAAHASS